MIKETKCLMCEHLIRDKDIFNHRCKAYFNGIPDEIFNDNSDDKNCKSDVCSFEYKKAKD